MRSNYRRQVGSVSVEALVFIPVLLVLIFAVADIGRLLRANDKLHEIAHSFARAVQFQVIDTSLPLRSQLEGYQQKLELLFNSDIEGKVGVSFQFISETNNEKISFGDCQPPENTRSLPQGEWWVVSLCFAPKPDTSAKWLATLIHSEQVLYSHAVFQRR